MRLRPRPSELFLITGSRAKTVHLGYVEDDKTRTLCGAKFGKYDPPQILAEGQHSCRMCKRRLKIINSMIEKLGVEWVCDGVWKDMSDRTYQDSLTVL